MAMQCAGGGGKPPDKPFHMKTLDDVVDADEENTTEDEHMPFHYGTKRSQCMHVCFVGLH